MKYSTKIKKNIAMLSLCAGITLVPVVGFAQATPTPGTTGVEQREEHHNYGWLGLLGLLGLAGLLRRRQNVDVVTRPAAVVR